ncbi:differentially expressed in FDCP 8 homolog isoform X2 [Condylostylus longicornis]|uniref:differentially expressed in FDCP 8 homolog isoform X2 n=1 Tax=Condylostylus longicornis TaxID=2530218 RepID=UPI00244E0FC0|nr:differentially expressed in FDCP 8 homolog isoform X2 [Condylostylus longicornis]
MNSLRESLSSIPGSIANIAFENPITSYLGYSSTPTATSSTEENSSEKSQAIPATLIKEQWQLVLGHEASLNELEIAIEKCKVLVMETEECTEERKWLVRHLVELRFHYKELLEASNDSKIVYPEKKVLLGHHFTVRQSRGLPQGRQYCDHCTGIVWSVVQSSYICSDCGFVVHQKCIDNVIRICAHVKLSERKFPILEICPEIGLAAQNYKCAECQTPLTFNNYWLEPRLCDYSGLFYCPTCHWNDYILIPARVVHNWDFSSRKVCRASFQEITLTIDKPLIKLEEMNPKLFHFLQKLGTIKKIRENLQFMRKYLSECRISCEEKLIDHNIGNKRHLIQTPDVYSLADLIQAESGDLLDFLNKLFDTFDKHIRNCEICSGKAYICEICNNKEVLYPYDDGCIHCTKCNSITHRACWIRKNSICLKCTRLEERKNLLEKQISEEK